MRKLFMYFWKWFLGLFKSLKSIDYASNIEEKRIVLRKFSCGKNMARFKYVLK